MTPKEEIRYYAERLERNYEHHSFAAEAARNILGFLDKLEDDPQPIPSSEAKKQIAKILEKLRSWERMQEPWDMLTDALTLLNKIDDRAGEMILWMDELQKWARGDENFGKHRESCIEICGNFLEAFDESRRKTITAREWHDYE